MNFRWFLRAAVWARKPPSERRIKFVFGIAAVCIAIGLIEYFGFWPEWAKVDRIPGMRRY